MPRPVVYARLPSLEDLRRGCTRISQNSDQDESGLDKARGLGHAQVRDVSTWNEASGDCVLLHVRCVWLLVKMPFLKQSIDSSYIRLVEA